MGVFGTYFAVFDGHNGAECAGFAAAQLHNHIKAAFDLAGVRPEFRSKELTAQIEAEIQVADGLKQQLEQVEQAVAALTALSSEAPL